MSKITTGDLAPIKLVDAANLPPIDEVLIFLEHAFSQGSQSWGVKREVGMALTLAKELHDTLELAQTADESKRKAAGLQLENGRLRKKLEKLEQKA